MFGLFSFSLFCIYFIMLRAGDFAESQFIKMLNIIVLCLHNHTIAAIHRDLLCKLCQILRCIGKSRSIDHSVIRIVLPDPACDLCRS